MRRLSALLVILCTCVPARFIAQATDAAPPDFLRSIGKMYVVVAVIVVVFLGLAWYLWRMDRRLTDIENQI